MTRLEELFVKWQDQDLTSAELEELGTLLETPEARALLREDFVTTHTIREALRTDAAPLPAGNPSIAAPPPGDSRHVPKRGSSRWGATPHAAPGARWGKPLVVAAGLLLAAAVLWVRGSSGPDGSTSDRVSHPDLQLRKQKEEKIREDAERKLAEIDRQKMLLEEQKPTESSAEEEKRKKAALLEEDRRRIEEEMKAAIAKAQQAPSKTPETPAKPEDPKTLPTAPERKDETPRQTEAAVATLERLNGEVFLVTPSGKVPAKAGENILPGQGLEVAAGGQAVFLYADQTRIEVGPETELRDLHVKGGKRIHVAKGIVRALVAKQPPREEMIIASAHGQAKILGTTLRISVDGDPKRGMRLEVEEGRVELKNLAGKSVDVPSGHYAVAAVGVELVKKPGVVPPSLLAGLLCHLSMDDAPGDAAADSSGNRLDGKLMNGASFVKGKVAGALRLNGSNQYVDLGRRLDLHEPYTLALWIRLNLLSNQTILSDHSNTSSLCHYALEVIPSGQVRYVWLQGDLSNTLMTQESIAAGVWVHVAVTKDEAGGVKVYLNGKTISALLPKKVIKVAPTNDFGPSSIGRPGDMDKSYTNGLLDDVRIYNRTLDPEEIAILARLGDR